MRVGEVANVDVVANAGSVLGWIVAAKDLDACSSAERDVEDQRNEVRFRFVRFAVAFDGGFFNFG